MPLVLGNWRAFGDSLAKTSIILSSVPLSRLFWSCPLSMWIQWLFLGASAYSLGQWGDRAALGMNIWINSSHEETVWQWVLTEEQSLQQSFNYFAPSVRCFVSTLKASSGGRCYWKQIKYLVMTSQIPPGNRVFNRALQFVVLKPFSVWAMDSLSRFWVLFSPPKVLFFFLMYE